jgi:hypothetical protein
MIRDAVTCDRDMCVGLFIEPDDMPEGTDFETAIEAAGWVSRPAVLALPGHAEREVTGHFCPACVQGAGPVLERGECMKCGGTVFNRATDEKCHYCGHESPHPEDNWDNTEDEETQ